MITIKIKIIGSALFDAYFISVIRIKFKFINLIQHLDRKSVV